MSSEAPGLVEPHKLAKKQQTVEGKVALVTLERASKLVDSVSGEINYGLHFDIDPDGLCVIEGGLHGTVTLCCQRCLQNFDQDVSGNFLVSPVLDDAAAKELPSAYEPVIMQDGKIDLLELLEDELILELPIVARHAAGATECKEVSEVLTEQGQDLNPFQVLQNLKLKKNGHKAEEDN